MLQGCGLGGKLAFFVATGIAACASFDDGGNSPAPPDGPKKCGGRARHIAGGYMLGRSLAPVGKHFYYGGIGALRRFDISSWLP